MFINRRFAIRVDASSDIGLGHLMRCLEIAKELKLKNIDVYFITYLNLQTEILKKHGYHIINLDEYYFSNEIDIIIEILNNNNINDIIIDKYHIEFEYFYSLKKMHKRVIYIDDLNEYSYPVDMIINGNITAHYLNYEKYNDKIKYLLGPNYYILRKEFIEEKKYTNNLGEKKINNILITTGGGDYKKFSLKILDQIIKWNLIKYHKVSLVVGSGYGKKLRKKLECIESEYENINLLIEPRNMAKEISKNDIIITAGGGTLYEALFLNKKIIAFIYAKNQEKIVNILEKEKMIYNIGWYNNLNENLDEAIKRVKNSICEIKKNKKFEISQFGAKNIVDQLLKKEIK